MSSAAMSTLRTFGSAGRARVARRNEHLLNARRMRALPCQRVLAAAAADDQDLHGPSGGKWRMPVNTIAMPCSSAAAMTSASRFDPPGWITDLMPNSASASRPSRNGKKASEAIAAHVQRQGPHRLAFMRGDLAAHDAAHLSGADAQRCLVLDRNDGIGFYIFRNAPSEDQIIEFGKCGRALGDGAQFLGAYRALCRAFAPADRPRRFCIRAIA